MSFKERISDLKLLITKNHRSKTHEHPKYI